MPSVLHPPLACGRCGLWLSRDPPHDLCMQCGHELCPACWEYPSHCGHPGAEAIVRRAEERLAAASEPGPVTCG